MQFEEIEQTNEYMETHYYKKTNYSDSSDLVNVNSFWVDYAEYLVSGKQKQGSPFLSANFVRNSE